ncbi:ethanolamine permease [Pontibacter sp. G13]|uniref:ethanolamine permease n=1 Tax=Pontibacter sp. G13 TaxID=3074898 RepID=UPI00288A70D7|nr:ethanolamine permease [Pontibacter sp. G13]WNJ19959.1 ethanolamine permease [Pontibacter sp. G13]
MNEPAKLKRTLGPWMLWGLGVGYVISGMYFGWNLGLPKGGTGGMALATAVITLMYVAFTFSYTELACAIPKAGGAFDYATQALGPNWGFLAGMAQNVEFIFAPPAIAYAIGAYFSLFFQDIPALWIAIPAYLIFTGLNMYGVKAAASFELLITILAVGELLIFAGATLPSFEMANLTHNAWPNGISGAFAAIPFAIWFYLAIEGVANVAEETVNPQRNILIGFGSAILTLVILCVLTFTSSVGVGGWEAVVYDVPGGPESDSPLPLALKQVVGESNWLFHLLITIGLFGLVASFHGIILAAGRASYEFGKMGFAFKFLGNIHPTRKTPVNALLFNMVVGIISLFTQKTGEIITLAVFGALTLYIISMVSVLVLRRNQPNLERPFKVPLYPLSPIVALVIASISWIALMWYNLELGGIFLAIMGISFIAYRIFLYPNRKELIQH